MSTRTMFALLLILAAGTVLAQEKFQLKYQMEKGKTFLYEDVIAGTTVQEMMGQEMKSTTRNRSLNRLVVDEVRPDGSMVLIASADSMVSSMKSARMDTTMVQTQLMGKRKKLVLSALGKVLDRIVVDSIKIEGMRSQGLRESSTYHMLSPDPVAVGGKWTGSMNDTVESMGGKMATDTKIEYTLVGKEKKDGYDCVKITYAGTFSTNGKGTMRGMDFFVEGTGKVAGTLYWGLKGYIVAQDGTIETESTAAITGQQNMTIPSSSSMTVTKRLIKN
jgi:hypothetical protein